MFNLRANLVHNALELFRDAVEKRVVDPDPNGGDRHLHLTYNELLGPTCLTNGDIAKFSSHLVARLEGYTRF